jgi:YidC/Oxa1 family membrane protein insertase
VALRQRYGKQPERLQREMAALYKREGTSMFAGFAPLLLQWPFLSVMYLLFRSPTVGGTANTLLTHDLFGVPLGAHWLSGAGPLAWPARTARSSSACSRCWRACAGSPPGSAG